MNHRNHGMHAVNIKVIISDVTGISTTATISEEYSSVKPNIKRFLLIQNKWKGGNFAYIGDNPKQIKKVVTASNMKKMKKKIVENWEDIQLDMLESILKQYFEIFQIFLLAFQSHLPA